MKLSTGQVAEAVGISRVAIDKKISRGEIETRHKPEPGLPREWGIDEVFRLALAVTIADCREGASFAQSFARVAMDNYNSDMRGQFLVVYQHGGDGWVENDVYDDDGEEVIANASEVWTCRMVAATDLADFLAKRTSGAIVINLEMTIGPVRAKLAAML